MEKYKYFLHELDEKIKYFRGESRQHKHLYRRLRYAVFSLTACSTALAGLALGVPRLQAGLNLVIVFVTATVGIITSIEGLRKPGELWIHERTTYYALLDLRREIGYQAAGHALDKSIDDYFLKMQGILGASEDKWNQFVAASSEEQKKQPGAAAPERKK